MTSINKWNSQCKEETNYKWSNIGPWNYVAGMISMLNQSQIKLGQVAGVVVGHLCLCVRYFHGLTQYKTFFFSQSNVDISLLKLPVYICCKFKPIFYRKFSQNVYGASFGAYFFFLTELRISFLHCIVNIL